MCSVASSADQGAVRRITRRWGVDSCNVSVLDIWVGKTGVGGWRAQCFLHKPFTVFCHDWMTTLGKGEWRRFGGGSRRYLCEERHGYGGTETLCGGDLQSQKD